jgi:hypothetical protein
VLVDNRGVEVLGGHPLHYFRPGETIAMTADHSSAWATDDPVTCDHRPEADA